MCSTSTLGHEVGSSPMATAKSIVFIVDDDAWVRESLETLIRDEGLQPETFASAREFLDRPRVSTPSCLVLDISLPGLDGLELQKRVAAERMPKRILQGRLRRQIPCGEGSCRPEECACGGSVSSRVNQFFKTSVFVPAPFIPDGGLIGGIFPVTGGGTTFGNLGRNILRGPNQHNLDMALIKRTKLGEKANMVFRWEVFNVFNHPNFTNPASGVSSPSTFGKVSAT